MIKDKNNIALGKYLVHVEDEAINDWALGTE